MTDTDILNALQALIDEHFRSGGLRFDFSVSRMHFVVTPSTDFRKALVDGLQPHLVRLVTNRLAGNG